MFLTYLENMDLLQTTFQINSLPFSESEVVIDWKYKFLIS